MRAALSIMSAAILLAACQASEKSEGVIPVEPAASSAAPQDGYALTQTAAEKRLVAQMALPFNIPIPKDPGGGYTHEVHKANASLIYDAGQLYQLTGEKKYADYAGKLMLAYADVYPAWGIHPAKKEQSPGRMFWQNLNESMWLLHVSQSYGAIKDTLSDEQRDKIETDVLRDMSEFLSDGSPETFNKVHNPVSYTHLTLPTIYSV